MHRPCADTENMTPEDFLCDFCLRSWAEDIAMIEGHQGSLLCADCLTRAYRALVVDETSSVYDGDDPNGAKCAMCLEHREDPMWRSPTNAAAWACRRCVKQGAGALSKDKEIGWKKPG